MVDKEGEMVEEGLSEAGVSGTSEVVVVSGVTASGAPASGDLLPDGVGGETRGDVFVGALLMI